MKQSQQQKEIVENNVIEEVEVIDGLPAKHKKFTSFLRQAEKHYFIFHELSELQNSHSESISLSKSILTFPMFRNLSKFQIQMHMLLSDILIFLDLVHNEDLIGNDLAISSFAITYSYLEMVTSQLDQVLKLHYPQLQFTSSHPSQIAQVLNSNHVEGLVKQNYNMIRRAVICRNELALILTNKAKSLQEQEEESKEQ